MLYEFERAVTNNDPLHPVASKAVGGVFYVGPTMKPPDHPDYLQLYALAEQLNAPIWIHPGRPQIFPDYLFDPALPLNIPNVPVNVPAIASKYYLFLLLDWLLDSSVAMARIVFANVFGLYPDVKIIIHHKGALVPLFRNRLTYDLYEWINQRVPGAINTGIPPSITGSYVDHFKNFYVDTVFSGDASFETEIVQIVYDFFGPDHVLFGTDAPVNGVDDGRAGSLAARYSVEALQVPNKDVQNIFSNNILNIIPD